MSLADIEGLLDGAFFRATNLEDEGLQIILWARKIQCLSKEIASLDSLKENHAYSEFLTIW